ncbi:MAG: c-type cytochrome [Longimicrobiales bacterium]
MRKPGSPSRTGSIIARTGSIVAMLAMVLAAGCGPGERLPPVTTETPAQHEAGAELLRTHCSACHGERAEGTDRGPPLVHRIYEPGHHADAAFQLAVAMGVRAHHWRYGDMAPVTGVSEAEVVAIIAYVRWLQREAGID